MNIKKFQINEEVIIAGREGIYTIEAYFEQMYIDDHGEVFELWYTVKDKEFGGIDEVRFNLISSAVQIKKQLLDKILDEYNDLILLSKMFPEDTYLEQTEDLRKRLNNYT